jgi:ATP-dependent DNA ligase
MINIQLCNSIDEEQALKLDSSKYTAQEKKDGERVICFIDNGEVILLNRRNKIITYKFPELIAELKLLDNCILDSEVCAYDNNFISTQKRALLQNPYEIEKRAKEIPCFMWVFDILKIGNNDLRNLPLRERIRELFSFFDGTDFKQIKLLPFESIKESLEKSKAKQGEGVVIKSLDGKYEGRRSNAYMKLKFWKETTLTIIGYTENNAGIRATDKENHPIQIAGYHAKEVKEIFAKQGYCNIEIQYLTKNEDGNFRFPSFRSVVTQ